MKKLFILAFTVLAIVACKKDDKVDEIKIPELPECQKNGTGKLVVKSSDKNSYSLYVNNSFKEILSPYAASDTIVLTAGSHRIKLEQRNGYILYPTVHNETVKIDSCVTLTYYY